MKRAQTTIQAKSVNRSSMETMADSLQPQIKKGALHNALESISEDLSQSNMNMEETISK